MKITEVDVAQYRIPLSRAMSDSTHPVIEGFDLILVQLGTDDGIAGIGYAKSIVDGTSISVVVDRVLAPLLRDADPLLIDDLWHHMYWRTYSLGRVGVTSLARAGHPRWRLVENASVMEEVWQHASGAGFPRRRIIDARLALTLLHHGVTELATANTKDFGAFGFERVWNPMLA